MVEGLFLTSSIQLENTEQKILKSGQKIFLAEGEPRFAFDRTLEWIGPVTDDNLNRTIADIKLLLSEKKEDIFLVVNSHGGPTGFGITFYDVIRKILKAPLTTIGTGDVDSSGILIYLSGQKRLISKNTTMFFHMAGRRFDERRVTTADMRAMLKEDTLKDHHYATLVASESRGKLNSFQVIEMMRKNTVLSAADAYKLGLADEIL